MHKLNTNKGVVAESEISEMNNSIWEVDSSSWGITW
jgi:hypothetical protein